MCPRLVQQSLFLLSSADGVTMMGIGSINQGEDVASNTDIRAAIHKRGSSHSCYQGLTVQPKTKDTRPDYEMEDQVRGCRIVITFRF